MEIRDTKSAVCNITTGVPQGSILGPLPFQIYIKDLAHSCISFNPIMYSDDTNLIITIRNFTTPDTGPSQNINSELLKITDWLAVNKLAKKSK